MIAQMFYRAFGAGFLRRGCGVSPLKLIIVDNYSRRACFWGYTGRTEDTAILALCLLGIFGTSPLPQKSNCQSYVIYLAQTQRSMYRAMNCFAITCGTSGKINSVSFYLPPRANSAGKTSKRGTRDF